MTLDEIKQEIVNLYGSLFGVPQDSQKHIDTMTRINELLVKQQELENGAQ